MQVFKGATALSLLLLLMPAAVTAAPPSEFPLHDAIQEGDMDRLIELLQAGHDPDAVNKYGQAALHVAIERRPDGGYLYVSELLNYGADPDAKDSSGATALRYASGDGLTAIASLLLQNGADVHARTHEGGSPLGAAYIRGYMDIVRLLESYGARMDNEAQRRRLLSLGIINAVVRRSAQELRATSAEHKTAWIARELRKMRDKHGLYNLLGDDAIRRIAREEGSTTEGCQSRRYSSEVRGPRCE